jgi:gamma-glutamylcyclotransferase (GGCT)/AIG2-like uncharacterized protein YtfP
MPSVLYFAYGSNMLAERLQSRCKSARVRGVARAQGFAVLFSKRSKDGSGKATLSCSETDGACAYGVVYEIDETELAMLGQIEGVGSGYNRVADFDVQTEPDGVTLTVTTYKADPHAVDVGLKPYDWYLDLVLAGARQHRLPVEYIEMLTATPSVIDPIPARRSRTKALEVLVRRSTP